jgi:hypothetical protein
MVKLMPCDWKRYPPNWKEIRARILERDRFRCKRCHADHHAVGYRDADGRFISLGGNGPCDYAGQGMQWPSGQLLSYSEAREFCEQYNDCYATENSKRATCDDDGNHWFVIVLTIAHLNHDTTDNRDSNLASLCQKCHLQYDAKHHALNAMNTRDKKRGQACLNL